MSYKSVLHVIQNKVKEEKEKNWRSTIIIAHLLYKFILYTIECDEDEVVVINLQIELNLYGFIFFMSCKLFRFFF